MAFLCLPEPDDCLRRVQRLLADNAPFFLGRIGGSDTDVMVEYFAALRADGAEAALSRVMPRVPRLKSYNGYYDLADRPENVSRFCEVMQAAYRQTSELFIAGPSWLTEYFPDRIGEEYQLRIPGAKQRYDDFLRAVASKSSLTTLYPYDFVERILRGKTLFLAFTTGLAGRKVLVVSPFSRSIRSNFHRRAGFFRGHAYPHFTLLTYDTPITYDGLPRSLYPHEDWFCTLKAIENGISQLDFDVALLACGSYATPLGAFIQHQLGRSAIYVGGLLQLYFGIMGRRYDENQFVLDQIDASMFIYPLERDDYLKHIQIGTQADREAFGAYF